MKKILPLCVVCYLVFVCLSSLSTQAQEVQIEKGFDVFQTLEEFDSEQSFVDCPIPGLTFESSSDTPLSDCETFTGVVDLKGAPLGTFRGVTIGAVDTIVERKSTLDFGDPSGDVTLTVDVEMLALNLVSIDPIEVICGAETTQWEVAVQVDQQTGPSSGQMQVTLEYPDLVGGTASSKIDVCPRVTFTRVDAGGTGSFEVFPCALQCGPELLGNTTWAFEVDNPDGVLKIEDLTTANFTFTGQPTVSQLRISKMPEPAVEPKLKAMLEKAGCPDPTNPCPATYPHQEATAAHLGCVPNPCAQDIEPPSLQPPPSGEICECSAKGGNPSNDSCVTEWLGELSCIDALGTASCAPQNLPESFTAGCGPDGKATTVRFTASDCCGNAVTLFSDLRIADTLGPAVTPGQDDFYCLEPPNHEYVCFDKSQFTPTTADVCGDVEDWFFTGCPSNQPENGQGDGDTIDDCVVINDGQGFCVRSERADPDPEGRRYAVQIAATDDCGNLGDSETIGFIHVAHGQAPADCEIMQAPCSVDAACAADPLVGEVPLTVGFANSTTSSCSDLEWAWDFDGDGVVDSTEEDPGSFIYNDSGVFTPSLQVTGDGTMDTATCGTIQVEGRIEAACSFAPSAGETPLTVAFTDQSTAVGTTITSWTWGFGDGNGSSDQNPTHDYVTAGNYAVTLTVSDGTLSDTVTCGTVSTKELVAACTVDPNAGDAPLTVAFTDQSTAGNTTITSWAWDFDGDGTIDSTDQNPSHVFNDAGTFTPTLTVSDGDLSKTATCGTVVTEPTLEAACSLDPTSGEAPLTVAFTDQSIAVGTTITSWDWGFGDGNGSTDQNPTHDYAAAGDYPVTLTVSDGNESSTAACGTVSAKELTAACGADPTSGDVPLTVAFTDQSTANNTTITSWAWDFDGDGTVDSTEQNPSYTYADGGTFTPTLTVSDGDLSKTTTCPVIEAEAPLPPLDCILPTVELGNASQKPVEVVIEFFDADGNPIPVTVDILDIQQDEPLVEVVGDGKETCPDAEIVSDGTSETAFVLGERIGKGDGRIYRITFTATTSDGRTCGGDGVGVIDVCVPRGKSCVESAPLISSLGPCP